MAETTSSIPPKLAEIIEDFQWSEGREKLELLLQYAEDFPPVPEWLREHAGALERVEECMTPVDVAAEMQAGKLVYYINVPASSPTVRGFASLLLKGLQGLTPEEILSVPADFYQEMGLENVLTYQRMNGLSAILARMKSLALQEISRS
jgi:cysteine desulfuration protein SufE